MLLSIVLKMIVAGGIHAILTLSAALLDNGILTGNFENVLDIKFFMLIAAIIASICQIGNVTSAAHYLLILMNSLLIMQLCYPLSSRQMNQLQGFSKYWTKFRRSGIRKTLSCLIPKQ